MSQSQTTLLQAVNIILPNIGEKKVTALSSSTSLKCQQNIKEAFQDIQTEFNWSWMLVDSSVDSWNAEAAFINEIIDTQLVYWQTDNNKIPLSFVHYDQFYLNQLQAFTDDSNRPNCYTTSTDKKILVNPYPTDVAGRARLKVSCWKYLSAPEIATDVFSCPESFIFTICKLTESYMLSRHLGDNQAASIALSAYKHKLSQLKIKQRPSTTRNSSMYRRRNTNYA